jgi:hypothetical protein
MENKKVPYNHAEKFVAKRDPYVGVVLEDVKDKFKATLEGYELVQKRIDRLDGRVGKLEARVDRLE